MLELARLRPRQSRRVQRRVPGQGVGAVLSARSVVRVQCRVLECIAARDDVVVGRGSEKREADDCRILEFIATFTRRCEELDSEESKGNDGSEVESHCEVGEVVV